MIIIEKKTMHLHSTHKSTSSNNGRYIWYFNNSDPFFNVLQQHEVIECIPLSFTCINDLPNININNNKLTLLSNLGENVLTIPTGFYNIDEFKLALKNLFESEPNIDTAIITYDDITNLITIKLTFNATQSTDPVLSFNINNNSHKLMGFADLSDNIMEEVVGETDTFTITSSAVPNLDFRHTMYVNFNFVSSNYTSFNENIKKGNTLFTVPLSFPEMGLIDWRNNSEHYGTLLSFSGLSFVEMTLTDHNFIPLVFDSPVNICLSFKKYSQGAKIRILETILNNTKMILMSFAGKGKKEKKENETDYELGQPFSFGLKKKISFN